MQLPPKLYVQYMPDASALQKLTALQIGLTTGRPVPTNELHLTVLHYGFVDETYKQLATLLNTLTESSYTDALVTFIESTKHGLPADCTVTVKDLDFFGPEKTVMVLVCKPDSALIHAYEQTMNQLRIFTESLGISSIADIPPQSRALHVPTRLTPHISLAKGVRQKITPPQDITGESLRLELFPLG